MTRRIARLVTTAAACALLAAAGFTAWKLVRADVESRVYRDRLEALAGEYRTLSQRYNNAVRRTAVTELLVQNDAVWVLVRSADGPLALYETPYTADREIFVDFIVRDGRLLTRRVYDDATPPRDGFVLDDRFTNYTTADEPQTAPPVIGKTVYRSLDEGRWLVEVTGNGALGLRRIGDLPPGGVEAVRAQAENNARLVNAPAVESYAEWIDTPTEHNRGVSPSDLLRALFGN
jgi:hypothetical protein